MLADVADASLFGQHALAYTLLAFGGVVLHRACGCSICVTDHSGAGYLRADYAVYRWCIGGERLCGVPYFLGCLTSTLLWAPLSILFSDAADARGRE